jgi:hypothetical protein
VGTQTQAGGHPWAYDEHVSTVEQPDEGEPTVRAYPPEQALQRARPLPARENLVIEDVSDDDWAAFQEALAEA